MATPCELAYRQRAPGIGRLDARSGALPWALSRAGLLDLAFSGRP